MPLTLTVLSPNPDSCAAWLRQGDITALPLHALPHAPWLSPFTPPLLLDSTGYQADPLLLCRVLDRLARQPADPVLALVDPADRRAHTLLYHGPTVTMIMARQSDPALLASWLRLTGGTPPAHLTPHGPMLLGVPTVLSPLPMLSVALPTLLTVLAEERTWISAAHRLGFSVRHLRRVQGMIAATLGCPLRHTGPCRWVAAVLAALATGGRAEDSSALERVPTP